MSQETILSLIEHAKSDDKHISQSAINSLIESDYDAVELIDTEIHNDSIDEKTEFTRHSRTWNEIVITYLNYGNADWALQLGFTLVEREPNNAATLNNYGAVLGYHERWEDALDYFLKAFQLDMKRGLIEARKAPAWQNVQSLTRLLQQVSIPKPKKVDTVDGSQLLFTRRHWKEIFWSDFWVGGLVSGFLVSVLLLWPEVLNIDDLCAKQISLGIALIGLVISVVIVYLKYRESS